MKQCEGFPQIGCENEATSNLLGYELCDTCAENWRTAPTREDQHAGATIVALRNRMANLDEAVGAALALLRREQYNAAQALLEEALRGKAR